MTNIEEKSGFLLVNKQPGWTSFDVVARLRNITGVKKIGHAGTLDPFASGLLVIAIGRAATKKIREIVEKDKVYETTLRLGAVSTTHDPEGEIEERVIDKNQQPSQRRIKTVIEKFIGKQKQIPPMYSAKKIGGKKLYQLARQGKEVERWPEDIEIFDIEILDYAWPEIKLKVHCSSGTYIRVLGSDVGQELGAGAYLTELKRTAVGGFRLEDSQEIGGLNSDNWQDCMFEKFS